MGLGRRMDAVIASLLLFIMFTGELSALTEEGMRGEGAAKLIAQWVSIDYDWEAMGADKTEWIEKGWFIVENCSPAGVKQWKEEIFITVPRWMPGVPSTLNQLVFSPTTGEPLLRPFPSVEYQNPNTTSGLKYVQDIEIDPLDRMWIIDAGFQNLFQNASYIWHQPRIIVIDLNTNKVLRDFELPSSIASPYLTFLNDIVVDVNNNFAYISNSAGNGGIYGYDYNSNQIRFWSDVTTEAEPGNVFNISGVVYDLAATPSDGIALTPDTSLLFYSPLAGINLYSLSTSVFRNFSSTSQEIAETVLHRGEKLSQSDGITFANNGYLYYGNIGNNAVNYWSLASSTLSTTNQYFLVQNDHTMQWQDTFAFDNQGSLLFMSNRLQLFPYEMDYTGNSGFNFHLFSVYINALSYMYPL